MRRLFVLSLLISAFLLAPTGASAFCIQNASEQRLFFEVGDYAIQYRKWIEPGSMACCDWRQANCNWTHVADGKLSVRVFDERVDAAQASCNYSVRADGHLRLGQFAAPEHCSWEP